MAVERWLIVGLGNPGKRYENTWHNLGRLALQTLARRHRLSVNKIRFKGLSTEGLICNQQVLLLAPETFMNLSGESVRAAADYYKIPEENIYKTRNYFDIHILHVSSAFYRFNQLKMIDTQIITSLNI